MSYRILKNDLPAGDVQANVMQVVSESLAKYNCEYTVIGATARDILGLMLNAQSTRRTADLDITIALNNWGEFDSIADSLVDHGFRHDSYIHQRFYYGHGDTEFVLDVVPYGKIAGPNAKYNWPNDEEYLMSVQGFDAAMDSCEEINLEDMFSFKIPSVPSLFVLKLIAWSDRKPKGVYKDAEDMDFLMRSYYLPNATEERFIPVYDQLPEFEDLFAGAIMIAMDICAIFPMDDLDYIHHIISEELNEETDSDLLKTVMLKHGNKFDLVRKAWELFNQTISSNLKNIKS